MNYQGPRSNYQGYQQGGNCRCGGLIMIPGMAYGYAGPICHCSIPDTITIVQPQHTGASLGGNTPQTGWICPKCNSSVNPVKDKCGC